jgi:hypothetical protein
LSNREPDESPITAVELSEVRWEMAEMKADLRSRIIDVELRLAWLRV